MKFLVTADNNGAIGRGAQPLVADPGYAAEFLKRDSGQSSGHGTKRLWKDFPVDSLLETASMWYFQKIRPIR